MVNEEALAKIISSYDFMRLGVAIQSKNTNAAMMIISGLQRELAAAESDMFDRELTNLRLCVISGNVRDSLDIMALITAKRVRIEKQLGLAE